jgi:uncharacterized protein YchJ
MIPNVLYTERPKITLNGVDISEIVNTVTITETLFDPTLKGHFTTINSVDTNLHKVTGSLGGLSKLELSFSSMNNGSPEKKIKPKDLLVYKIVDGASQSGNTMKTAMGYFATKPLFVNSSRLISKYFEDTISNIVSSLCKEIEISCNASATEDKIKKVLTYDSVFAHIALLTKQARSKKNPKDVDFVFYQDIDGEFHFKSLSEFKKQETKWKYKLLFPSQELKDSDAKYSILRHNAEELSPIKNALNGMYSSEIVSFDSTTGDYVSKTHVLSQGKYTTISNNLIVNPDKEPEFGKIAKSGVAVRSYNKQRFLHDCSEPEDGYDKVGLQDDWVGNRLASMQSMDQVALYLNVPGNSEMKVGDIIEVRKPIDESLLSNSNVQQKEKDILNTGKFMITTISHDIVIKGDDEGKNNSTYTMRIKAIKDSKGDEYA